MRLDRLDLLRYGHFTDAVLALPATEPDLHILLGPNEAGKSTARAAVGDLLFGVPRSTDYAFLHDNRALRLGAVLARNGAILEVRRRKGSKDTLLGPDDLPLPTGDGALAPFLDGADRAFLERMFSLDHQRLRRGGEEILEARDEVGRMLFAAGAGLAGLGDTLKALEAEADGQWGPRRAGHRAYARAEDRLKEADARLRADTVTAARWQELKAAAQAAEREDADLERAVGEAVAEQRRLGRIRRTHRHVRRRAELTRVLAALGPVTPLPEDAAGILAAAEAKEAEARARLETLRGERAALHDACQGLACEPALLAREAEIGELNERRVTVRHGTADLPKRRAELALAEAELRRLAAELEWDGDDPDRLIARIPPRARVAAARALLGERGERRQALETARAGAEEAARQAAELQQRLEAAAPPPDVSALAALVRAIRGQGDLATHLAAARAERDDAAAMLDQRLDGLCPSVAGAAALAALAVPPRATVQDHRDRDRALDQRAEACRERRRAAAQELERRRAAHDRLIAGGEAVAPDQLAAARAHRDRGWRLIRRRHLDGAPVPEHDLAAFAGLAGDPAAAYEAAVHEADALADRRFDKAEAAARLSVLAEAVAAQQDELRRLAEDDEALERERATRHEAWRELWAVTPLAPLDPDAMLAWLTAREDTLAALERRDRAARRLDELAGREAEARTRLLAALASLGVETDSLADQPLAVLLEAAADIERGHQTAAEARRQHEERLRQALAEAERGRRTVEATTAAWADWQARWAAALDGLGLAAAAEPAAVAAQAEAIDAMREHAVKANELRHGRIGTIERDAAAFARDVARLTAAAAPDLAGHAPDEAVLELAHRLDEARRVRDLKAEKQQALAGLDEKIAACEEARGGAREAADRLREQAGAADLEQLRAAIEASNHWRAARDETARLAETLVAEGDGLSLEELEAECGGADLDRLAAREERLREEIDAVRERHLDARTRRAAARRELDAVGGGDAMARAAADRQAALAEMRAAAARYSRARAAALLLRWAIERFRREQQAPLLRRAGAVFAALTGGSFTGLRVDLDEQDRPRLIGVRPDRAAVPVPGLSTGTADQLYLALRIAAVEEHLDRAAPLPFIADDLFINFDDARAAAGFRVLGGLAARTQVLFLTHHRHLVEIAHATLGDHVPVVPLDGAGAAAATRARPGARPPPSVAAGA